MIFFADENDENLRLDSFLASVTENLSRSKLQELIKSKAVKVNGADKKPSYSIKESDKIELDIPEHETLKIEPQDIPLEIVYEDENMLVINKPSGMLTHPTTKEKKDTLVNALLFKYGENLSDINGEFRRGIVHRLDKNTSGLLMIAKNNETHEYLAQLIKNHDITKKYRTVVKGVYPADNDIIDLPIGRHPTQPHKMAVVEGGKESTTVVQVLERFKEASYLEITLITGRTHQIRVHLSHKGFPVINDTLYGAGTAKVKTDEQVLQSFYLKFKKPFFDTSGVVSEQIIELEIEPDEKIKKVLGYLKNKR